MTAAQHATLSGTVSDNERPGLSRRAETLMFGFWIFLMSDAIIFALLFATYAVMLPGTASGPTGSDLFDLKSVAIETFVLLLSSFTFGMATISLKYRTSLRPLYGWLVISLLLALVFLGFELHDFATMFAKAGTPDRSGFLSAFFALVPLHGLHVAFASIWLIVMLTQIRKWGITDRVKIRLLQLGLLWHFLDIIWIVIFSLVYLQGLAS